MMDLVIGLTVIILSLMKIIFKVTLVWLESFMIGSCINFSEVSEISLKA